MAAAGIAVVELAIGMATSASSPANALSDHPASVNSVELVSQASDNQLTKKDDEKKGEREETGEQEERDDDDIKLLPQSVTDAIFKEAAQQSGIEASKLRILKVERETWSDGCLGLGGSESVCTQSLIPGWRVLVASAERRWVFRANESGSLIKLDEVATRSITSDTTALTTRREEVTTSRTTQTTQSVSGSSQSVQAAQSVTGSTNSQSTQAIAGSSQTSQATNVRTQQQVAATRSTAQMSFTDISQDYWARDFIAELTQRGIITGFPDGKFHPNEPVTRAQFAAMLASVFKKDKVRNAINFRDVSSSYWAYQRIREAYEMGLIGAVSGGQFRPYQSLTRLEILTGLAKALNYTSSNSTETVLQVFRDAAAIPADARNLVAAATERGIMENYPNTTTCSPNKVATRAEVAAFLYQAMVSTGDAVAISSPYIMGSQTTIRQAEEVRQGGDVKPARQAEEVRQGGDRKPARQNCNQGIGNGAEGCDPGNSRPHGGSNDETGRTPGNGKK